MYILYILHAENLFAREDLRKNPEEALREVKKRATA